MDTSAFIALEDADDEHHEAARYYQLSLAQQSVPLVTTNFVLDETYTWLRAHLSHARAVSFGERIKGSALLQILHVSEEIESLAWAIFVRYDDKAFSYTDCTSFVAMQLLGLDTTFAFDRHFMQFGFTCAPETS